MSELEQQNFANKPRNRRAVVKGAAWSVPVIAAAIAAPAASASLTGTLVVSTLNCAGVAIGSAQPTFVITATGDSTPASSFTITGSTLVNASLQNAWSTSTGVSVAVLTGNTWSFNIPALAVGQSITYTSNAALANVATAYTGQVATGSKATMTIVLGATSLLNICTTS